MASKTKEYRIEVTMQVTRTYNINATGIVAAKAEARNNIYHDVMIDDPDVSWDYEYEEHDLVRF